ncbi:hypothetical protein [Thermogemmatispora sp.]|uniref:hypothetical protein n=1 Tax=Thermogemmatispora sp. TaxID=1968838 RepID=UPI001D839C7E|nr:hypothetical protein [Thermogemmatispora sp.]MBX5448488.1 hypothetical protein [Thermogemmatispora sp.]
MPWFTDDNLNDHDGTDPAPEVSFPTLPTSSDDLADLTERMSVSDPAELPSWQSTETASPPLPGARPTRRLTTSLPPVFSPSALEAGWSQPLRSPTPAQGRVRRWLPLGTFLLGMLSGASGALALLLVMLLMLGTDRPPLSSPPAGQSDVVLQLSSTYLTALVTRSLPQVGLPGQASNVRVILQPGALVDVTGDETLTLLGVSVTRPFTLQLQPLASACHLQVHLLHADLGGLPLTWLALPLETRLNELLTRQPAPTGLPSGFRYCTVAVHTTADALWISYRAEPTAGASSISRWPQTS